MYDYIIVLSIILVIALCLANMMKTTKKNVFDQIYLINLKRRPDRLERFMNSLDDSDMKDMKVLRMNAVDGSEIDITRVPLSETAKGELKQIETTGFRSKHYQLTRGAIGCYLSHVKVWKDIVEKGHKNGLIFEDDVTLPENMYERMMNSMKGVPDDWDVLLFGFHCKECENMKNYRKVDRFILLHCYAISYSGIVKMLKTNSLFPITQQIDSYMSELSPDILNIYTVKNPIIHQNGSRTDIQMPIIKKKNDDVNARMKVKL